MNCLENKRSCQLFFIWFFIASSVIVLFAFIYDMNSKVNEYLDHEAKEAEFVIKTVYSEYKHIADLLFTLKVDTQKIREIYKKAQINKSIARKELFEHLSQEYRLLQKSGIDVFHFHLADNSSFLRFHKPSKFNDDLSLDRKAVAYVNKTQKKISCFELGKFFNAYRFIYPIFDENKNHLGSMEISILTNTFAQKIRENFNTTATFLVDKNRIKYEKFKYIDNMFTSYLFDKSSNQDLVSGLSLERSVIDEIENKLPLGDVFSLYDSSINMVISVVPLFDSLSGEVIAATLIYSKSQYIEGKKQNTLYGIIVTILSLAMIFSLLYREFLVRNKLKAQNDLLEDRVQEELEKIEAQRDLYHQDKLNETKFSSIGKLTAGITHEINTPLTYIKGNFEMIKYDIESLPDSNLKKGMLADSKKIYDGINRIANIVESMREMSQTSKGKQEKTNIFSTLITSLTIAYNRSKQIAPIYVNGEVFEMNIAKDKYKLFSNVQKQRLGQVWIIIVNNALDELIKIENHSDRRIDIELYAEGNQNITRIRDNAGGIPSSIIDNVFDPFVSSKESGGIGIGLNIAKNIIDAQKGRISAYNENGGAVFEIRLPATTEEE
jgi:signal transduction histidine kinase